MHAGLGSLKPAIQHAGILSWSQAILSLSWQQTSLMHKHPAKAVSPVFISYEVAEKLLWRHAGLLCGMQ